jgi:hypothetical protein
VLRAYCDESYDKNSRIYTIAGFVGRDREWDRISRRWKNRCIKNELQHYHSADVEGRFGSCSHLSPQDVISLNTDLITYIVESNLVGWATSIILEDFRTVAKGSDRAKKILGTSPYFLAMQTFLVTLSCWVHEWAPNYRISFVFEEQEEFSGRAKRLYDRVKIKNPTAAECMGTLTYADKRRFIPLQIADKLAYEAMKNLLNLRHDHERAERVALTRMKDAQVIASLNYLNREFLERIVKGQT